MKRFAASVVLVLVLLGSWLCLGSSVARAQPFGPGFTSPPPVPYVPPVPSAQVFAGGRYSLTNSSAPGFSRYGPGYVAPMFYNPRYLSPGPYFYTPTPPFTPSYYGYYYTPGYFRY